jgi:hypothetical protein
MRNTVPRKSKGTSRKQEGFLFSFRVTSYSSKLHLDYRRLVIAVALPYLIARDCLPRDLRWDCSRRRTHRQIEVVAVGGSQAVTSDASSDYSPRAGLQAYSPLTAGSPCFR